MGAPLKHFLAIIALLLATAAAADPLTHVPAIGVNAWERGACMSSADYAQLGANNIRYFRTGFNQEEAASLDDTVLRAAQGGVQVLPILHSYNGPPVTEAQLVSFSQFARDMVLRYGPQGTFWFPGGVLRTDVPYLPLRAWEVWNEPNLSANWGGLPPNATQYYALLSRTSAAVHLVDYAAAVLFGGIALKDANANGHGGVTFIQNVLSQPGAGTSFQALSVHSYPITPADIENHLNIMRSTLNGAGNSAQIWLTEFGWPTGGTTGAHPAVSLATQDAYLADTLTRVENQRAALKLGPVIWFAFRDLTPGSSDPCQAGFGTTSWSNFLGLRTSQSNGNNAKPAWTTMGTRAGSAAPLALPLVVNSAHRDWLLIP